MDKDDEDDADVGMNVVKYNIMPSLVALQSMRNRLHLAHLGKKLMKWTALATGKELRRLSQEMALIGTDYGLKCRDAFMSLARCRYQASYINIFVKENCPTIARATIEMTTRSVAGVKVINLGVEETGPDGYSLLGLGRSGETVRQTKQLWYELLQLMVARCSFLVKFKMIDDAHKAATKKQNVLQRLIIPKINITSKYILSELDEMEREETFRLKRFKQLKYKYAKAGKKTEPTVEHAKGEPPTLFVECIPDCTHPKGIQLRGSAGEPTATSKSVQLPEPCDTCKTVKQSKAVCETEICICTSEELEVPAPPCADIGKPVAEDVTCTCAGNVEPSQGPKVDACMCAGNVEPSQEPKVEPKSEDDACTCAGNVEPSPEPEVEPKSDVDSCTCAGNVEPSPEPEVEPKSDVDSCTCAGNVEPSPEPEVEPKSDVDSCTCDGNVEPPPEPEVKPKVVCYPKGKLPTSIEAAPPALPCGDNRQPLAENNTCAGNVEPSPVPKVEPKSDVDSCTCAGNVEPSPEPEVEPKSDVDSCTCAGNVEPPPEPEVKPKVVCYPKGKPPTSIEAAPPALPCGDNRKPLAENNTCAGNVEPTCIKQQSTEALMTPEKMKRLGLLKKHIDEVIRAADELEGGRKTPRTDSFLKRCHDVKNKIEILTGPGPCQGDKNASKTSRPGSAASSICGKSPDNVSQISRSDSCDDLGTVVKTFKETVTVKRSKNLDGTLSEKKTIVTIKTEKRMISSDGERSVCGSASGSACGSASSQIDICDCEKPNRSRTSSNQSLCCSSSHTFKSFGSRQTCQTCQISGSRRACQTSPSIDNPFTYISGVCYDTKQDYAFGGTSNSVESAPSLTAVDLSDYAVQLCDTKSLGSSESSRLSMICGASKASETAKPCMNLESRVALIKTNVATVKISAPCICKKTQPSCVVSTPSDTTNRCTCLTPSVASTKTPNKTSKRCGCRTPNVTSSKSPCGHRTPSVTSSKTPCGHPTPNVTSSKTPCGHPTPNVTSSKTPCGHPTLSVISSKTPCGHSTLSVISSKTPCGHPTLSVISSKTPCGHPTPNVTSSKTPCGHGTPSVISSKTPCGHGTPSVISSKTPCGHGTPSVISSKTPCGHGTPSVISSKTPCGHGTPSAISSKTPCGHGTPSVISSKTPCGHGTPSVISSKTPCGHQTPSVISSKTPCGHGTPSVISSKTPCGHGTASVCCGCNNPNVTSTKSCCDTAPGKSSNVNSYIMQKSKSYPLLTKKSSSCIGSPKRLAMIVDPKNSNEVLLAGSISPLTAGLIRGKITARTVSASTSTGFIPFYFDIFKGETKTQSNSSTTNPSPE